MNNKNIQSVLQAALENEIPPAQIRLWPAIEQRLAARKRPLSEQGDASMKTNLSRTPLLRRAALAMLVFVAVLALLLATPQGQIFAQSILRFFTRAASDRRPLQTAAPLVWVDVTPGVPAPTMTPLPGLERYFTDCGNIECSTEQIRSKLDFPVKELGSIPQGMYFLGATGRPGLAIISYGDASQYPVGGLVIFESSGTSVPEELLGYQIGPSAIVETVQIGNVSGEIVRGIFTPHGAKESWNPNQGMQTLRWVQDGIFYQISDLTPPSVAFRDAQGFVALANGLTTDPVSAGSTPVPTPDIYGPSTAFKLSVSEAEQQAGFHVLQAGRLPTLLSFLGASYEREHKIVHLFYDWTLFGPNTQGLTLSQQPANPGAGCELCGFRIGDGSAAGQAYPGSVVKASWAIETVQIGDLTGEYIQGSWVYMPLIDDWYWWDVDLDARKILRWQAHGMAFELMSSGIEQFTKADLITIAESIK